MSELHYIYISVFEYTTGSFWPCSLSLFTLHCKGHRGDVINHARMEKGNSKELEKKIFELTLALYRVTDFFPPGEALRKHLREKANEIFGGISEYSRGTDPEREIIVILGKIESVKGYLQIARSMRFVKPINLGVLEREYSSVALVLERELDSLRQAIHEQVLPKEASKESRRKNEPNISQTPLQEVALSTWDEHAPTPKDYIAGGGAANQENIRQQDGFGDAGVVWGLTTKNETPRGLRARQEREHLPMKPASQEINERQRKIIDYIQGVAQAKISDFFSVFQDISSKTIQRDLQDLVVRNVLRKEGEKRWTTYFFNNVQ